MGTVLQFKPRPSPALDPRHGSWVVAVTCRRWGKVEPPELEFQGCRSACELRWLAIGGINSMLGTFYQIMPVGEFERVR